MKAALIIASGIKQIMLTAESDEEERILECVTINDNIQVEAHEATLYDSAPQAARGYTVSESRGGFLRAYECKKSLMLVLRRKDNETKK